MLCESEKKLKSRNNLWGHIKYIYVEKKSKKLKLDVDFDKKGVIKWVIKHKRHRTITNRKKEKEVKQQLNKTYKSL